MALNVTLRTTAGDICRIGTGVDVGIGDPVRDSVFGRVLVYDEFRDEALQFVQVEAGAHRREVQEYGFHRKLRYSLRDSRR